MAAVGSERETTAAPCAARRALAIWMLIWVLTCFGACGGAVVCNEYDTCFPAEIQLDLTDSIRQGNRKHTCTIASSAMECLDEARKDCDEAGYQNLPDYIVRELEDKRHNVTVYKATYCGEKPPPTTPTSSSPIQQVQQGSNGGDVTGSSLTATVWWTLLLTVVLCVQ